MIDPVSLIVALISVSTPVLLAATGELVVEKSGVLNLGVEGMMIIGAVTGFIAAYETGSPATGFAAGALGGLIVSLLFALVVLVFLANQVASGLALTLFGLGLAALMGATYTEVSPPRTGALLPEAWTAIPVAGPVALGHDAMIYASVALVAAVAWLLARTRAGLILRAVGESHDAAHALGYKVVAIRAAAIAFGGACAGLGGAYLSLVRVPSWTEGMTAGAGWIALALVVFAGWKPWRVLLGAYLFGGISALQLRLQGNVPIPEVVLSALPYLVPIVVLAVMSSSRGRAALNAPAALGRVFHPSA